MLVIDVKLGNLELHCKTMKMPYVVVDGVVDGVVVGIVVVGGVGIAVGVGVRFGLGVGAAVGVGFDCSSSGGRWCWFWL